MATLKPREIDAFIARPDPSYPVIMLYGPDSGLVSERANKISENTGIDLSDPFNLIKLSADEATADPIRITDEANTISMFGSKRLIRISGRTQRDMMKCLKPVLETPPDDALIVIEAGDLAKSSGLRRNLEKHQSAICIPCYQDNDAALDRLISEEITDKGLSIDSQTRKELVALLGSNRLLSRNELQKLALYCENNGRVTAEDLSAVVGDSSNLMINELIDCVGTGNTALLQNLMPKAIEAGNAPDIVLLSTLKYFQQLQAMRHQMDKGSNPASIVAAARPPVHFSRKNKVISALSIWPVANLSRALARLDQTMLECRKNALASASIAGTTLLALTLEAKSLNKR